MWATDLHFLLFQNATCCAGYFGPSCQECPGGAEVPCSGRGLCFDTYYGNGTCQCSPGFMGPDCSQCQDPSMALPACNTTHPTCETETSGCHENAVCKVNLPHAAQCTCMAGYHGNGTWCTMNVDPCHREDYGGCDGARASCQYTPPRVTDLQDSLPVCSCLIGYEGNGTLCTENLLDLVSRLPQLNYFQTKLDLAEAANTTDLMESLGQNTTLFAPISKNYASLDFSNLVVTGDKLRLPDTNPSETPTAGDARESIESPQKLPIKIVTALGGQQINITVDDNGQLYANDVPIVVKNIATMNGLLHITESPISSFSVHEAKPSQIRGKSDSTIIALCVIAVILIIIIVIVVAVLFVRSKKNGGFKIFNRSRSTEGSDTSVSFARLNALEDDENSSYKGSDSAKYDNPIFNDPDNTM
ncbi:cysteine-rich with EGF-like domain protein 2 [Elysia marginata]|uniref:Cysteine-rich with EGF-like domain protein 2 n=1 Tax=Elysia marginata TaxID=1093978 RepID=A0AAV4FW03_9GAST|nr:cysteine-rich with EGF-like domain protein 2 [Elysia marginata]